MLKDEDESTVSDSGHSDDVFATVQSQVKNLIKNYSYQICDKQSELRCALKISFHSKATRVSKMQRLGSLASESLISTTKLLSRIDAATTCD